MKNEDAFSNFFSISMSVLFTSLLSLLISYPLDAWACRTELSLTSADRAKADFIFEGRLLSLKIARADSKDSALKSAPGLATGLSPKILTFEIEKTVSGRLQPGHPQNRQIEVQWINGTFGEVDTVKKFRKSYGSRSRVGVVFHDTIAKHLKCSREAAVRGDGEPTSIEVCRTDLPLPFEPRPNSFGAKPWVLSGVCTRAFIETVP